jgi:hypothetical protein
VSLTSNQDIEEQRFPLIDRSQFDRFRGFDKDLPPLLIDENDTLTAKIVAQRIPFLQD